MKNKIQHNIISSQSVGVSKQFRKSHRTLLVLNLLIVGFVVVALFFIYNLSEGNKDSNAQVAPSLTQITPGAETNYDKMPYIPPTNGRIIPASANASDIQSKVNTAQPGDIIEVADGTYSGNILINVSGTPTSPIIIRAKSRHGTTVTNCGSSAYESGSCFRFKGSNVVVQQFKVITNQAIVVFMSGYNNVLYDNLFQDTGNGQTGAIFGIVHLGGATDGASGGGPVVQRKNMVVKNEFIRPKNTAIYNHEGSGGNIISHNIIRGPGGINNPLSVESEAFKNGCCGTTDMENHFVRIQFNSVYQYGPAKPYLTSFKFGDSTYAYNKIINNADASSDGAHMETRRSRVQVVGNLMIGRDAGIFISSGSGQLVKYNKIYATGMRYGKGALQITGKGCYGPTSCYDMGVAEVSDNVVYNSENLLVDDSAGQDTQKPVGSIFRNNTFLRPNNGPWVDGGSFSQSAHTWQNNIFHCINNGCNNSTINPGITLGTNGNRAGDPGVAHNPTDQNQTVAFDPQYVAPIAGSVSSKSSLSAPSVAVPALPAPAPPPNPPAPIVQQHTPIVITPTTSYSIEAESMQLLGNPSPTVSANNVTAPGASHIGFSGNGYLYSWQPKASGSGIRMVYVAKQAGLYQLAMRYSAAATDIPLKNIKVGTTTLTSIDFPKTADWDSWNERKLAIQLVAGNNSIDIVSDAAHPANGWMNIDKVTFGFVSQPSSTASNNTTNAPVAAPSSVPNSNVTDTSGNKVVTVSPSSEKTKPVTSGTPVTINAGRFTEEKKDKIQEVVIEVNGKPAPVTNGTSPDTALDTSKLAPGIYTVTEQVTYKDGTTELVSGYVTIESKYAPLKRIAIPSLIGLGSVSAVSLSVLFARRSAQKKLFRMTHMPTGL